MVQGGVRKARMEILRHVIGSVNGPAVGLEVGIGSGENLRFLAAGTGPSMASTSPGPSSKLACAAIRRRRVAWPGPRPRTCRSPTRRSTPAGRSAGSTTISDHEAALREMRRVTKPGGPVVVADELPGLHRAGLGHLLGIPSLDAWWLRKLGLDREFVEMVLAFDVDLQALVQPRLARGRAAPDLARAGLLFREHISLITVILPTPEAFHVDHEPATRHDLALGGRPGTSGAASSAEGALQYDHSSPALVCSGCATRLPIENDILIVKAPDHRQQPGRPAVLRQPALAQVSLLGVVHLGLQRRRAPGAQQGPPAPAQRTPGLDLLDVAIGDGVYLDWLPADWRIVGVDISRSQLDACRRRAAGRSVWLAQGEAEELPLESHSFDAVSAHRRLQLLQ